MTAIQTIAKVRESAGARKCPSVRQVGSLADFDFSRQGDLYIHRLPAIPKGATLVNNPPSQVAPGNTQGSRHCIADVGGVKMYQMPNANALQGPIIDAGGGFTLEHPEHGHQTFPAGVYAITFQRAHADTLRRTQD